MAEPKYNLEVRIPPQYIEDDVFQLAHLYNEQYLPLEDRLRGEKDALEMDAEDLEMLFEEERTQVLVVSILHLLIDIPDIRSIKEKRQIVKSLKDRLQHKFKMSVAEVDYQDTLRTAQIGAAVVSNSKQFGESVLQKALSFAEDTVPGRIRDATIFSEHY